ncbi:Holliday junction branch migration protein RuvA [Porphyromonas pogonae]|uniref:Holliday junction branch migration protein RuvA n=1 Tax=Porphyromonas pogonae TaxID=867595 RepID=UPI002E77BF5C|nr:Holliday junction branch migration protein RuvA [Porphyromonas pogonae]
MIAYLRGDIAELTPTMMIVECGGVGYSVNISLTTYTAYQGKREGKVLITQIIREDAHLLYGFATSAEQELFRQLNTVSGVGPNTARVILSTYAPAELNQIITLGQTEALKAVKGIGLKTAQRIIVDLKGKLVPLEDGVEVTSPLADAYAHAGAAEEASKALKMLGYGDADIRKAVRSIVTSSPSMSVEEIIKKALRLL